MRRGEPTAAVCVFAKPPIPGRVKTRLASGVGAEAAATLARAFLADTWAAVSELAWASPILATTERAGLGIDAGDVWLQGQGDLGARLERILRRALEEAPMAIAIGADTPGLPGRLLEGAREALQTADAVLGPCDDGGFYLLGLRREACPRTGGPKSGRAGLLDDLPWSAPDTFDRTLVRLEEAGLRTRVLSPWFDVDRPCDLVRLRGLLASGELEAPKTARVLEGLSLTETWTRGVA